MGVGLVGSGIVGYRDMSNKVVCEEAAGNNCRLCIREADIHFFYRRREDGVFQ